MEGLSKEAADRVAKNLGFTGEKIARVRKRVYNFLHSPIEKEQLACN